MTPPIDWQEEFSKFLHSWFIDNHPCDLKTIEKLIVTCWQIWRDRNEAIFRNKVPGPKATMITATCHLNFMNASLRNIEVSKNKSTTGNIRI